MDPFHTLLFILLFSSISACTNPILANLTAQSNFNLSRFLGIWYEIEWLPGEPHNESDIWRDFYLTYELANNSIDRLEVPGKARLLHNDTCFSFGPWSIIANNSAKMILERRGDSTTPLLNWPHYVLKTDYDNYALVYGCVTLNYNYSSVCFEPILWVFSRAVTLANEHRTMLDDFIETTLCINRTRLEITPHSEKPCSRNTSSTFANFFPSTLIVGIGFLVYILFL